MYQICERTFGFVTKGVCVTQAGHQKVRTHITISSYRVPSHWWETPSQFHQGSCERTQHMSAVACFGSACHHVALLYVRFMKSLKQSFKEMMDLFVKEMNNLIFPVVFFNICFYCFYIQCNLGDSPQLSCWPGEPLNADLDAKLCIVDLQLTTM